MQSIKRATFGRYFIKKDNVLAKRKPRENLKVCETLRTKKKKYKTYL